MPVRAHCLTCYADNTGRESAKNVNKTGTHGRPAHFMPMSHDPKRMRAPSQSEPGSNAVKDPDNWTTGDETMTGAQANYLQTLGEEAGEPFDANLTKAEASKRIDDLQARTGRGRDH
jgi:hypothetical protein